MECDALGDTIKLENIGGKLVSDPPVLTIDDHRVLLYTQPGTEFRVRKGIFRLLLLSDGVEVARATRGLFARTIEYQGEKWRLSTSRRYSKDRFPSVLGGKRGIEVFTREGILESGSGTRAEVTLEYHHEVVGVTSGRSLFLAVSGLVVTGLG